MTLYWPKAASHNSTKGNFGVSRDFKYLCKILYSCSYNIEFSDTFLQSIY